MDRDRVKQDRMKQVSKLLSFVLRHQPDHLGLTLGEHGFVEVEVLLAACRARGTPIAREELEEVVRTSDKKRFELSGDGARIRAAQGHSVEVDLGLEAREPPALLYHGTWEGALEAVLREGLEKMKRHAVHLSADRTTAIKVGSRRGRPRLLEIAAGEMFARGHIFQRSSNGVWLTERVPPEFIRLLPE